MSWPSRMDAARRGLLQPADHVEQRGLPGAVRPDQTGDHARLDGHRDVVEGDGAAEADGHADDLKEGHRRRLPRRRPGRSLPRHRRPRRSRSDGPTLPAPTLDRARPDRGGVRRVDADQLQRDLGGTPGHLLGTEERLRHDDLTRDRQEEEDDRGQRDERPVVDDTSESEPVAQGDGGDAGDEDRPDLGQRPVARHDVGDRARRGSGPPRSRSAPAPRPRSVP